MKTTGILISEARDEYLRQRQIEGLSQHTLKAYRLQLEILIRDLGDVPIGVVNTETLREHLGRQSHLKPSSLAHKARAIRVFFKWAYEEDLIPKNIAIKLKEPKLPKRIPKHLTIDELEVLRDACETPLEHALVEVLFATGCRVGELHRINISDVDFQRRSIFVIGKAGKEREVYFGAKASIWLRRYLESRQDNDPALIVTERRQRRDDGDVRHRRMSIAQIEYRLRKVSQRAGLGNRVTPHILRHTLATTLLNQGASLVAVQSLLGHDKPETTQLYTTLSGDSRRRAYDKYFVQ